MPKINEDGTEVTFKILPHYREDILAGRKKVDFRCLGEKWHSLTCHAKQIRYACEDKPDVCLRLSAVVLAPPEVVRILPKIYADVSFNTAPVYILYFDELSRPWEVKDGD